MATNLAPQLNLINLRLNHVQLYIVDDWLRLDQLLVLLSPVFGFDLLHDVCRCPRRFLVVAIYLGLSPFFELFVGRLWYAFLNQTNGAIEK